MVNSSVHFCTANGKLVMLSSNYQKETFKLLTGLGKSQFTYIWYDVNCYNCNYKPGTMETLD